MFYKALLCTAAWVDRQLQSFFMTSRARLGWPSSEWWPGSRPSPPTTGSSSWVRKIFRLTTGLKVLVSSHGEKDSDPELNQYLAQLKYNDGPRRRFHRDDRIFYN